MPNESKEVQSKSVGNKPVEKESKSGTNWKDLFAPFVAVVLLVFYIVFLISLRGQIGEEELVWTRWIYLLSGLEAIVFAATGYLFGKEVHRGQAEAAEQRTEEAQQNAVDANQRATEAEKETVEAQTKGKALASAIIAKTAGQAKKQSTNEFLSDDDATATFIQSDFDELASLAKDLFP